MKNVFRKKLKELSRSVKDYAVQEVDKLKSISLSPSPLDAFQWMALFNLVKNILWDQRGECVPYQLAEALEKKHRHSSTP